MTGLKQNTTSSKGPIFILLIEELISKGKSYSEIVSILETDQLPITSNIRLYIKTLLPK